MDCRPKLIRKVLFQSRNANEVLVVVCVQQLRTFGREHDTNVAPQFAITAYQIAEWLSNRVAEYEDHATRTAS